MFIPIWLLWGSVLLQNTFAQGNELGQSLVNATSDATTLTNLTLPINSGNRPRRSSLSITTDAQNPRKLFPAGSLLWTYLEIINAIYEGDTPLSIGPDRPWVRGCIFGFQCTYYHVNEMDQPPAATIAWGMIGIINEQFRLNTANPSSAIWKVESWRYAVNGRYVTEITNNFETLETNAVAALSSPPSSTNGTAPTCSSRRNGRPIVSRLNDVPGTWMHDFQWSTSRIPLRSILALFFDLFIRFFFRYPVDTPIEDQFRSGYIWNSGRDPSSNAFIQLEITNATAPGPYGRASVPIGDLYKAVHCFLFFEWIGTAEEEEAHQRGFGASFSVYGHEDQPYARLTMGLAGAKTGLQELDQNTWTGGSMMVSAGLRSDNTTVSDFAASR